jgi:hypothetical protein
LHDYAIPSANGASGITQLRPGLISVPTGPEGVSSSGTGTSTPIPVPARNGGHAVISGRYRSPVSGSWGTSPSPYENGIATGTSYVSSNGDGGWSLPRSSIRSVSVSSQSQSQSRSGSGSASDEESVDVDADGRVLDEYEPSRYDGRYGRSRRVWKREEDDMEVGLGFSVTEEDEADDDSDINISNRKMKESEWDELEMDMDMD